ncbi:MAG: nucleotidyltransferase family protein [Coriobacteriaceae bacterium]|nr:nucleotidyltransferase family protein [Coriobacteriaceae bacterium]
MNLSLAERYAIEAITAWNKGRVLPALTPELAPSVLDELSSQTVLASLVDSLLEAGLPDRDAEECLKEVGAVLNTWFRVMMCQDEVLGLLREGGVKVAVLKGAAAAMYYPEPERRYLGDIDLIVGPNDFTAAAKAMLENGWSELPPCEKDPRHVCFSKEGCPEVELHHRFGTGQYGVQDEYLDRVIVGALKHVQVVEVGGFQVPMLPMLENGLVLLAHARQHLSVGIGLRQVLDWMFFVENELDEVLWEEGFEQAAVSTGMKPLAMALTLMCKRNLGLKRDVPWCEAFEASLTDELLEYVMSKGNMGHKVNDEKRASLKIIHGLSHPVRVVKMLHSCGCARINPTQDQRVPAISAVFNGAAFYFRKSLGHGVTLKSLREESGAGSKEMRLFEQLGVTRL